MAFDAPMWKKNFRNPPVVIGITTGFLGVVALYVEQLHPVAPDVHSEYGVLILLFGCISWPLGTLYTKYRSSGEEDVNAFAGSAWQMIFAGAVFWVVSLINGDVFHTNWGAVPPSAWRSLSYLIVFGSILAYSAYIWLLKIRSATEVGTHAYVNPFIAVFIGMYFGNEQVTTLQLAGLAVILFSVLLINRRPRR
jgi:drug/metabolite transporter (DMT)-like permease